MRMLPDGGTDPCSAAMHVGGPFIPCHSVRGHEAERPRGPGHLKRGRPPVTVLVDYSSHQPRLPGKKGPTLDHLSPSGLQFPSAPAPSVSTDVIAVVPDVAAGLRSSEDVPFGQSAPPHPSPSALFVFLVLLKRREVAGDPRVKGTSPSASV
ncbi:unnamed protein product [Boreogadus saida]